MIARLLAEPHRFSFFQAVRLLNRWFNARDSSGPSAPLTRRVRFRNTLSLSFPASEIAEFKPVAAGTGPEIDHVEMTPAFMSLLGSSGALPIFYTEILAEREAYHRDTGARAFLDVFQHRAVSLFYEAWRKHRLPMQYESDQRERFLPLVLAIAGVGQDSLRNRLQGGAAGVFDDTIAYFSGLLQQRPVSARTIQQVVAEYFSVVAHVEQFVGRWFTLPSESNSLLGEANAMLGANAVVGERVWQRDLRMRLTIGPLARAKLRLFLPGGPAALALRELLTLMTGVSFEYEVRLSLAADEVQGVSLECGEAGASLGWDSFLTTRPALQHRTDAGYDIHALH